MREETALTCLSVCRSVCLPVCVVRSPCRRWVRLLFGREFPLQDLLVVWDALFADSITLDLVDYVFVAMLLYIRDARTFRLRHFVRVAHSSHEKHLGM